MSNLIELVVAITLAFVLSHISLLLLLGRHEEVYRGLARLTDNWGGDDFCASAHPWTDAPPPPPAVAQPSRLAYPMYDDGPVSIPQAVPASNSSWGAPIAWQNPGSADHQQRQAVRQQGMQQQPGKGHCFTNNYYLGQ